MVAGRPLPGTTTTTPTDRNFNHYLEDVLGDDEDLRPGSPTTDLGRLDGFTEEGRVVTHHDHLMSYATSPAPTRRTVRDEAMNDGSLLLVTPPPPATATATATNHSIDQSIPSLFTGSSSGADAPASLSGGVLPVNYSDDPGMELAIQENLSIPSSSTNHVGTTTMIPPPSTEQHQQAGGEATSSPTREGATTSYTTPHAGKRHAGDVTFSNGEEDLSMLHNINSNGTDVSCYTEARSFVNGLLSPFSPLLLKKQQEEQERLASTSIDQQREEEEHYLQYASLQPCRKVSVVVRVLPVERQQPTDPNESLESRNSRLAEAPKCCIFRQPRTSTSSTTQSMMLSTPDAKGRSSVNNSTTMDTTPILLQKTPSTTTSSSRKLIIVNPSAFGKYIPSQITMETARLVAQVANISSEDWARLYQFHHILWPPHDDDDSSHLLLPDQHPDASSDLSPRSPSEESWTSPGGGGIPGASTYSSETTLASLARAAVQDALVEQKSSVLLSMGQDPTCLDFSKQKKEGSEAHNSTTTTPADGQSSCFAMIESIIDQVHSLLEDGSVATFSLVELVTDKEKDRFRDGLEFTQKQKPSSKSQQKPKEAASQLAIRHVDRDGAILENLIRVPIDQARQVLWEKQRRESRRKRKSITLAWIATVSIFNNAVSFEVHKAPTAEITFVEMASSTSVVDKSPAPSSSPFPSTSPGLRPPPHFSNYMRNHNTVTLGLVLRQLLLHSTAGTEPAVSYRESTLTKILQRSLESSKIVLLASVSQLSQDYEGTIQTLNYLRRLLVQPGKTARSPFHRDGSGNVNDTLLMNTTLLQQSSLDPTNLDDTLNTAKSIHQDQFNAFVKSPSLLETIVADPRQRLAKVFKSPPAVNASILSENEKSSIFHDYDDNEGPAVDYMHGFDSMIGALEHRQEEEEFAWQSPATEGRELQKEFRLEDVPTPTEEHPQDEWFPEEEEDQVPFEDEHEIVFEEDEHLADETASQDDDKGFSDRISMEDGYDRNWDAELMPVRKAHRHSSNNDEIYEEEQLYHDEKSHQSETEPDEFLHSLEPSLDATNYTEDLQPLADVGEESPTFLSEGDPVHDEALENENGIIAVEASLDLLEFDGDSLDGLSEQAERLTHVSVTAAREEETSHSNITQGSSESNGIASTELSFNNRRIAREERRHPEQETQYELPIMHAEDHNAGAEWETPLSPRRETLARSARQQEKETVEYSDQFLEGTTSVIPKQQVVPDPLGGRLLSGQPKRSEILPPTSSSHESRGETRNQLKSSFPTAALPYAFVDSNIAGSDIETLEMAVNQIQSIQNGVWKSSALSLDRVKDSLQTQRNALMNLASERDELQAAVAAGKDDMKQIVDDNERRLLLYEEEFQQLRQQFDSSVDKAGQLQSQATEAMQAKINAEDALANMKGELDDALQQCRVKDAQCIGVGQEAEQLAGQLRLRDATVKDLTHENEIFNSTALDLTSTINHLKENHADLEHHLRSSKAEMDALTRQFDIVKERNSNLVAEQILLKAQCVEDRLAVDTLKGERNHTVPLLETLQKERNDLRRLHESSLSKINHQEQQLEEYEKQMGSMKTNFKREHSSLVNKQREFSVVTEERSKLLSQVRNLELDLEKAGHGMTTSLLTIKAGEEEISKLRNEISNYRKQRDSLQESKRNELERIGELTVLLEEAELKSAECDRLRGQLEIARSENVEARRMDSVRKKENDQYLDEKENQLSSLRRELNMAMDELQASKRREQQASSRMHEHNSSTQEKLDRVTSQFETSEMEKAKLAERLSSVEKRLSQQTETSEIQEKHLMAAEDELVALRYESKQSDAHNQSLLQDLGEQKASLDSLVASLEDQLGFAKAQLESARRDTDISLGDRDKHRSEYTLALQQVSDGETEIGRLSAALKESHNSQRRSESRVMELESRLNLLERNDEDRVRDVAELQSQASQERGFVMQDNANLKRENARLVDNLGQLQRERDACLVSLQEGQRRIQSMARKTTHFGEVRMNDAESHRQLFVSKREGTVDVSLRAEEIAACLAATVKDSLQESHSESHKLRSQVLKLEGAKETEATFLKARILALERLVHRSF